MHKKDNFCFSPYLFWLTVQLYFTIEFQTALIPNRSLAKDQ